MPNPIIKTKNLAKKPGQTPPNKGDFIISSSLSEWTFQVFDLPRVTLVAKPLEPQTPAERGRRGWLPISRSRGVGFSRFCRVLLDFNRALGSRCCFLVAFLKLYKQALLHVFEVFLRLLRLYGVFVFFFK